MNTLGAVYFQASNDVPGFTAVLAQAMTSPASPQSAKSRGSTSSRHGALSRRQCTSSSASCESTGRCRRSRSPRRTRRSAICKSPCVPTATAASSNDNSNESSSDSSSDSSRGRSQGSVTCSQAVSGSSSSRSGTGSQRSSNTASSSASSRANSPASSSSTGRSSRSCSPAPPWEIGLVKRPDFGRLCLEVCCSPQSTLTRELRHVGCVAIRVNLENGYNMSTVHWRRAARLPAAAKGACRVWASPECKWFSRLQNLVKKSDRRTAVLNRGRRQSKRDVRNCIAVLIDVMQHGGYGYFEWPTSSHGWNIGPLRQLRTAAAALGQPLHEVRFHGCAFGMRSTADRSSFVPKVWRVLTNDSTLHEVARICPQNHSHVRIHNVETRATAFYPTAMARAIAKHIRGDAKRKLGAAKREGSTSLHCGS